MPKIASRQQYLLGGFMVALAAIGLYGLIPRVGEFSSSIPTIKTADPWFLAGAVAFGLLSAVFAAIIYTLLSIKRLVFTNTLLVEFFGLFINRILPAGVGGLGLNYLYLRAHKHTVAQATSVVALNNSLGFIGHALLAVVLVIVSPAAFKDVRLPDNWLLVTLIVSAVTLLIVITVWHWQRRRLRDLRRIVKHYVKRPRRLAAALLASSGLTMCHVTSLWLSCRALGLPLSFLAVFVVFTFGIAAQTATPTPGGLGGLEAAVVAALVVQHVPAATALAAVLLYRLATYWVGLAVGALAGLGVHSRHLLQS